MNKSIYSLVLSDEVVDAVDALARSAGMSRSAMINGILAERVAFVTPEMRLRGILESLANSMTDAFMLSEKPTGSTLVCRTSLKYRYKPTVKYSVEIFSENGKRAAGSREDHAQRRDTMSRPQAWAAAGSREDHAQRRDTMSRPQAWAGQLKVSFRSQNAQLIGDLTEFFKCWTALEQKYIAERISGDILYTIQDGRFTRTLNMPSGGISEDELGTAVADYMAMLDGAMKEYFLRLPDEREAARAAEDHYRPRIAVREVIV